jgi:hypothetical protein
VPTASFPGDEAQDQAGDEAPEVRHDVHPKALQGLAGIGATGASEPEHAEHAERGQQRDAPGAKAPYAAREIFAEAEAAQQAQCAKDRRGGPDGEVCLMVDPRGGQVTDEAAGQDGQPPQAFAQSPASRSPQEKGADGIGHDMREVGVEGERRQRPIPLAIDDEVGFRSALLKDAVMVVKWRRKK